MKISLFFLQSTSRLKAQRILPPRGMRRPTTIWWRRDSLWTLTSIFWKNTKRSTKALRRWWTCVPWKYGMFTTAPLRSFDQTSLKIWREWAWCHTNSGSAGKVNLWKFRWAECGKWVSTKTSLYAVRRTIFGDWYFCHTQAWIEICFEMWSIYHAQHSDLFCSNVMLLEVT